MLFRHAEAAQVDALRQQDKYQRRAKEYTRSRTDQKHPSLLGRCEAGEQNPR
jgi:hypothetical protein